MRELLISIALACLFVASVMFITRVALAAELECSRGWAPRDAAVAALSKDYSEDPVEMGLASNGSVMELFRTKDGETWTLLNTVTNGCSRIVTAGEAWMAIPIPASKIGPTS
jgi:hypothetical protein